MVLQYYWHGDLWHSWLFPEQFLLQKCSFRWFTWLLQIKRSVLFMGHTSQQKQNLTKEALVLVVKYWLWKACKTEIFWFWLYKLQFIAIHCDTLLSRIINLMNYYQWQMPMLRKGNLSPWATCVVEKGRREVLTVTLCLNLTLARLCNRPWRLLHSLRFLLCRC